MDEVGSHGFPGLESPQNSLCLFGSILLGHLLFRSGWSSASGQMGFRVAWVTLCYTLYTSLNTNVTSPVYIWIVFALHLNITWCNAVFRISSIGDNLVLFQVFDAGRVKVSDLPSKFGEVAWNLTTAEHIDMYNHPFLLLNICLYRYWPNKDVQLLTFIQYQFGLACMCWRRDFYV